MYTKTLLYECRAVKGRGGGGWGKRVNFYSPKNDI
jgi:hypothetical protein